MVVIVVGLNWQHIIILQRVVMNLLLLLLVSLVDIGGIIVQLVVRMEILQPIISVMVKEDL
jgi:hypothetical protein